MPNSPTDRPQPEGKPRLSREDWLQAAQSALVAGGIEAVRIGPIAQDLGVTRGSFYWHFRNREDLYEALLVAWESTSTALFEALFDDPESTGMQAFLELCELWLDETSLNPAYDSAMRDWARTSKRTAVIVRRVDNHRISLIQRIFVNLGYDQPEAFIRARVTYFHQVGYYALGLDETKAERQALLPLYLRVLTGNHAIPEGQLEAAAGPAKKAK